MKRKGAGYHHGDLRRTLVEATLQLVAEHGPDGFTLRAAAQLAGVSDGAPYHHFTDKEALLAAAAAEGYRALSHRMERAAASERDERAKSQALAVAYVLFAARSPSTFRLMFGPLSEDRARHPELAEAIERVLSVVRRAFSAGFGEGERSGASVLPLAAWALVHGLSLLAIEGHLGAEGRSARRLERLVRDSWAVMEPERRAAERDADTGPRSGHRLRTQREDGLVARR